MCTDCELYAEATQTVFGEGPAEARLALIGEQPGDAEDRSGRPFVGPAGRLLDDALAAAGIDRAAVYVTNAVKHFRWRPAGKVRLHQKPNAGHVRACAQWWHAELEIVDPEVVVLLGATAAQAVLGPSIRVNRDRGAPIPLAETDTTAIVTIHPSAIVRLGGDERDAGLAGLVQDLELARRCVVLAR